MREREREKERKREGTWSVCESKEAHATCDDKRLRVRKNE